MLLEKKSNPAVDDAFQLPAALRASCQRLIIHFLLFFERIFATGADIGIRRHVTLLPIWNVKIHDFGNTTKVGALNALLFLFL